jgi:lysozyme
MEILASGSILAIISRGAFIALENYVQVSSEIKQAIFALICLLTAYFTKQGDILTLATALFTAGTLTHAMVKTTYLTKEVSQKGKQLLKESEGYSETAYSDIGGTATIGYGNTFYPDGTRVKIGDSITKQKAETLFEETVRNFSQGVASLLKNVTLNTNQYDALVSLAYNIGIDNFKKSTVLKLVLENTENPEIKNAWLLWNKVRNNGKLVVSQGLVNRRNLEISMYFSKDTQTLVS